MTTAEMIPLDVATEQLDRAVDLIQHWTGEAARLRLLLDSLLADAEVTRLPGAGQTHVSVHHCRVWDDNDPLLATLLDVACEPGTES